MVTWFPGCAAKGFLLAPRLAEIEKPLGGMIKIDDLTPARNYVSVRPLWMQYSSAISSQPSMKLTPPKGASLTAASHPAVALR
jgi:hypothetical protein